MHQLAVSRVRSGSSTAKNDTSTLGPVFIIYRWVVDGPRRASRSASRDDRKQRDYENLAERSLILLPEVMRAGQD
jgi:hypothetical protein